jgi:hypothetical protein
MSLNFDRISVRDEMSKHPTTAARIALTAHKNPLQKSRVFLHLEGPTDRLGLDYFLDQEGCRTWVFWGKDGVREAVRVFAEAGDAQYVAVADADCEHMGVPYDWPPQGLAALIRTETHDLEMLAYKSDAVWRKLRTQLFDADRLADCEEAWGCSLRDRILRAAAPIGFAKYVSAADSAFKGLRLNEVDPATGERRDLDYASFIVTPEMACDIPKLCAYLVRLSPREQDAAKLCSLLSDFSADPPYDPYIVCRGHDVSCLLAMLLNTLHRQGGLSRWNRAAVEERVRFAFQDAGVFRATNLYRDLVAQERRLSKAVLDSEIAG